MTSHQFFKIVIVGKLFGIRWIKHFERIGEWGQGKNACKHGSKKASMHANKTESKKAWKKEQHNFFFPVAFRQSLEDST